MQPDSHSSFSRDRHPAPPEQTEFARQIGKWRLLLARSARKPTAGAVHDLRVATLRLQAGIEDWAGRRHDHPLSRNAARWIAQAGKLRDVLGAVRDADVTLGKLKMLRGEMLGSNGVAPADGSVCMRQIKKLEREVKRTRRAGARELVDWLEERGTRLERRMLRLEKELDQLNPFPTGCGRALLSEFLSGQASSRSTLDRKTLHEFRKHLKNVRYIIEISASGERSREVLSVPLRKLQSALGEWHDWDSLVRTAQRALGARGEAASLVQRLEDRAAKALRSALAQTRRLLAALSAGGAKRRPLR
jgi:CHAD domain-containing protein